MTRTEPEMSARDAARFERMLLDSARADESPPDVSAAWARFGASLAGTIELAARGNASGSAVHASMGNGAAAMIERAARIAAIKWLVVGVLAGSALTLLSMNRAREWGRSADVPAATSAPVASAASLLAVGGASSALAPPVVPSEESGRALPASRLAPPRARLATPARRPSALVASSERAPDAPSDSTLGAQVALLDGARTALAAGAFGEVLAMTERYQQQFPNGELAPDAEVVALEALAAQGDHETLAARATRFLARYPADPHWARVKSLAQRR